MAGVILFNQEKTMDKVFIKNLLIRGIIGISEVERSNRQDIVVNVILFTDTSAAAQSDNIEDCVNYRTVAKRIMAHVERTARYTVEALASDLMEICLSGKGVHGARVRVEKPGAVRFSESVGVEIERFNK
jgi:FolB domain-containing protein